MAAVTQLLDAAAAGDAKAAAELLPLVYAELRALAAHHLAGEKPGQTLQATALVHEAYIRLVGPDPGQQFNGRGHFFAAAAEAMRRILVDAARRKGREKHGGGRLRLDLEDIPVEEDDEDDKLIALDPALDALARFDPVKAELVKLRYFAGLTIEQSAACLDISPATAKRHWAVARAWLFRHLSADRDGPG
ncbi:MAG TPA: sigma-70 family RNA polymerase sigma factor [Fimbriiglobus sp.]|nr:sigma-70 family RNA polymerase sigma factor [Fimbriiglobus sp.]